MDRRSFFKSALDKGRKSAVKAIDATVEKQATRFIRPPFAIDELEFLLACTRCGDCVAACPHNVVFNLSARLGVKFAGTPALDILNKGCHLCEDWPCVKACIPQALKLPEIDGDDEQINPAKLATARINADLCLPYSGPECGACFSSCKVEKALVLDMMKPSIDMAFCTGCGLCRENCITEPKAINISARLKQPAQPIPTTNTNHLK